MTKRQLADRADDARGAPNGRHLGRYQLGPLLGTGGMAEVFKATDTSAVGDRRTVVVKRILPTHSHDTEFVRLFMAEAKILGLCHHPNVVEAYDFGESGGVPFLVLEYVDGPSVSGALSTLRASGRKMPMEVAAHFAHEVCQALEYVHTLKGEDGAPLKTIHRDVTPSNIILTNAGGIKLLDFGVARYRVSDLPTSDGPIQGKVPYLAPEALEGKAIDCRVDLFSLGVVLHEMLTLTRLFQSDSHVAAARKILTLPMAPPSKTRPSVPPELDAIVMKALERDPANRYQTAREMASDLQWFVSDSGLKKDRIQAFVDGLNMLTPPRVSPGEVTVTIVDEVPRRRGRGRVLFDRIARLVLRNAVAKGKPSAPRHGR
ncbi:MAG TPA: serine/threonine-protein kinase [Polyangia bacterium]|jgi:serine/threonine protein kinase|nr:serine/threonine-protein kinase [Polyangia bacterium]